MYRPNRIGPWPLVDVDASPVLVTKTNLDLTNNALPVPKLWCPDAVVNEVTRAANFDMTNQAWAPGANASGGFGIQVNGAANIDERNTMFAYHFACHFEQNDDSPQMMGIIGRVDAAAQVVTVTNNTVLPNDSHVAASTANGAYSISGRGCFIVGDFVPSGTEGTLAYVLGLLYWNPTGGAHQLDSFKASLSLYRYSTDLNVFDPNR